MFQVALKYKLFFLLAFVLQISYAQMDTISLEEARLKTGTDYIIETRADENHTLVVNELMASNASTIEDEEGDYDDWFEIYNFGDEPLNLKHYFFTDNAQNPYKWRISQLQDTLLHPGDFMVFWADGEADSLCHTNFKLSSSGEYLAIFHENGALVDEVTFGKQSSDISYGRYPDGGLSFHYMTEATPGKANSAVVGSELLSKPWTSTTSGIFKQSTQVTLHTTEDGAQIYYTTDFSEPNLGSSLYNGSILVDKTTIIRARTFKEGYIPSSTLTLSFIFDNGEYENPIISLVSDEEYLKGEQGILDGEDEIEVPAHMEFIENGHTLFASGMGVKLHSPKKNEQYSMRFYARSRYGSEWFEYPFFGDHSVDKFKRLIIRNGGNDAVQAQPGNLHFRDLLIQRMAKDFTPGANISESRPVNVFINGKFFGLYNLRERIDEHYMSTHFPDLGDHDLLERAFGHPSNRNAIDGDWEKWDEILQLVDVKGDTLTTDTFNRVAKRVDIENFTNYWLTEIIIGNYDWLSNNIKFFVPEQGKAQWIYWDTDHGLGLVFNVKGNPDWNTLDWSLGFSDRAWNTGFNNKLIRNLLKNEAYKEFFIRRLSYLLNVKYTTENTFPKIDSLRNLYANDIERHIKKWGRTMGSWEVAFDGIKDYLSERPAYVFDHARTYFGFDTTYSLKVSVYPKGAGSIRFENYPDALSALDGRVFSDYEYTLEAKAGTGYRFVGWKGIDRNEALLKTGFAQDDSLTAVFELISGQEAIVLNEVYFNSPKDFGCGDWLELGNMGQEDLGLAGYKIYQNDQLLFEFSKDTIVQANNYLVIAEDSVAFNSVFQFPECVVGQLNAPLEDASKIVLCNANGDTLQTLNYNMGNEWPVLKNGFSYEIKNYHVDSNYPKNWQVSVNRFGSPGMKNGGQYAFSLPKATPAPITHNALIEGKIPAEAYGFSDTDGHYFSGVRIYAMAEGYTLYANGVPCELMKVYPPNSISIFPDNENIESSFAFSVIDNSGDESGVYAMSISVLSALQQLEQKVKVYPNPGSEYIFIEGIQGEIQIDLLGLNGVVEKTESCISDGKSGIDISDMPNGSYVLRIRNKGQNWMQKIIIY